MILDYRRKVNLLVAYSHITQHCFQKVELLKTWGLILESCSHSYSSSYSSLSTAILTIHRFRTSTTPAIMWITELEGRSLTIGITVTCGVAFMLFGFDQGVFGGILGNPRFMSTFKNPTPTIQGQIVSTYDIGCILGALMTIFIGTIWVGRGRLCWHVSLSLSAAPFKLRRSPSRT
jgi:hypothetical protein